VGVFDCWGVCFGFWLLFLFFFVFGCWLLFFLSVYVFGFVVCGGLGCGGLGVVCCLGCVGVWSVVGLMCGCLLCLDAWFYLGW